MRLTRQDRSMRQSMRSFGLLRSTRPTAACHGNGYSIGGLTRYPISPSATIAIRPTSMILPMLKPRLSHASLDHLASFGSVNSGGQLRAVTENRSNVSLELQAPGRTHRTMPPLALEAPNRRWIFGDSIKKKLPLERPSGQGADARRLGRMLENRGRSRPPMVAEADVQTMVLSDLDIPEVPRALHVSGRAASCPCGRAGGVRPLHQDLVDPRSVPFDPPFHRARPGRGRGGGLAITPAHQFLTRHCFAPDHAAAHLKPQAILRGRAAVTDWRSP
jgi:hypothetical protein